MGAVFPKVGKKLALNILLDDGRNPKLRLFKNNIVPDDDTVLATLTVANFSGYAEVSLNGMAAAAINGTGQGFREKLTNAFVHNGGGTANTVYGWYVVIDNLVPASELLFVEKFPAPQVVGALDDTVEFDLTFLDELGT